MTAQSLKIWPSKFEICFVQSVRVPVFIFPVLFRCSPATVFPFITLCSCMIVLHGLPAHMPSVLKLLCSMFIFTFPLLFTCMRVCVCVCVRAHARVCAWACAHLYMTVCFCLQALSFSSAPDKVVKRSIPLRNVGNMPCNVQLALSPPSALFGVQPNSIHLSPQQVTILSLQKICFC